MTASKVVASMDLFGYEPTRNILPFDGTVNYYGPILTPGDAADYREALLTAVPWRHDEAVIYGRHISTARKVAWYGDTDYSYRYSGHDTTNKSYVSDNRARIGPKGVS
jgi:alkylated DNA repair dioxygenase AlkB